MTMQDSSGRGRTSFFNDAKTRAVLYQVLVVAIIVAAGYWLIANAVANLRALNQSTGFDFLWRTAGFEITFSLIPLTRASYYWQLFVAGVLNTLLASMVSIILATILGFILGMARLSKNWIIAKMALFYVEITRNIPLLLWLFVWYFAVLKVLPGVRQSISFGDVVFINQRGLFFPTPVLDGQFLYVLIALVVAVACSFVLRDWANQRLERTGKRFPVGWSIVGLLIVLPALAFVLSGTQVGLNVPALAGFNFRGGVDVPPELTAMILGLTLYTATFIGEIVRSGIQAVSHGQTEASQALGLKDGDRLRLVVLPQALRVIIPPLTSEYLSLTKNSTLGAAIGYPEVVNVFAGTALNQTGRAFEIIGITMLFFLTFSAAASAFMNWFNARVALVER